MLQNPYSHKQQPNPQPAKLPKPATVTAIQAGLHPASKLVETLLSNNKKKQTP